MLTRSVPDGMRALASPRAVRTGIAYVEAALADSKKL